MRLLIYALETSGASLFCLFAGQLKDSVAIVDLWSGALTPRLDIPGDVVVKATVTMRHPLTQHIESFSPDKTVLFVRNPAVNYTSLSRYPYANDFGTIDEKFASFDQDLATWPADLVFRYEDLVARDSRLPARLSAIGWRSEPRYFDFKRSTAEIQLCNMTRSEWARDEFDRAWGFGNIKSTILSVPKLLPGLNQVAIEPAVLERVQRICPHMSALYAARPAG